MNSRKGKKKSKPHPAPATIPENKETQDKVGEVVELEEKQSVTEKVSDIILKEVKPEDVLPKKPKRNRGKKKKNDNEEEITEECKSVVKKEVSDSITLTDPIVNPCLDSETKEKINIDTGDDKCAENEKITPTIRKNKNKKKEHEPVKMLPDDQTIQPVQEQEQTTIEECSSEFNKSQEQESAKKINKKKKKRHDSEKLDNVEDISSTTAIQQLIKVEDEETETTVSENKFENKNVITESHELTTSPLKVSDTNIDQRVEENIKVNETSYTESILLDKSDKDEFHSEKSMDENKNKKKSKKNKKPDKEACFDAIKNQEQLLTTEESISKNLFEESVKDTVLNMETFSPSISEVRSESMNKESEVIESLKAKAVIDKPVEKKKKGKQDFDEIEKKADISTKHIKEYPKQTEVKDNTVEDHTKLKEEDLLQNIASQDLQQINKNLTSAHDFEVIPIPDTVMGKKRKKSPKPPKVIIPLDRKQEVEESEKTEHEVLHSTIELPLENEVKLSERPFGTLVQTDSNVEDWHTNKGATELISKKKCKKAKKIPLTPGVTDFTPTFETNPKTDYDQNQTLAPQKIDQPTTSSSEFATNILTESLISPSTIEQVSKSEEEINQTDIPFIDTYGTNLDIDAGFSPNLLEKTDSVKSKDTSTELTENSPAAETPNSEVTTPILDIIPDIQYPRSTSQGYDNNNNTVIREARPDELQLTSLKDMPVVQGSGETPIGTPKMFTSDIIISEVLETEKTKEKTDLKSKMLEVNRDMEGLRLSIERSLAEFTAIEKSEQNIEKEYEDRMKLDMQERNKDLMYQKESITEESENKLEIPTESDPIKKESNVAENTKNEESTKPSQLIEDSMHSTLKDIESPQVIKKVPEETNIDRIVIASEPTKERLQETIMSGQNVKDNETIVASLKEKIPVSDQNMESEEDQISQPQEEKCSESKQPIYPARKGKNKKKRGRLEAPQSTQSYTSSQTTTESKSSSKEDKKDEKSDKSDHKSDNNQEKGKQQSNNDSVEIAQEHSKEENVLVDSEKSLNTDFEPIENFEDALTSSTEDVDINKSFDMIVTETIHSNQQQLAANKPEIKIIGPDEKPKERVTQPKNLLGHPNIPVSSNKTDYKKEKNKTPNTQQAKVKIKDYIDVELPKKPNEDKKKIETSETDNTLINETNSIENISEDKHKLHTLKNIENVKENGECSTSLKANNQSINVPLQTLPKDEKISINDNNELNKTKKLEKRKDSTSQTEKKKSKKNVKNKDSFTQLNENEEFVYKYSFRKVFLPSTCNVCKKELKLRIPCNFCNLLFYCSDKHKDEDWPQHQALCFAICTIGHMKDQKYIYADTKNLTGQNYRLVRMQMILSCEKVLKRRLVPWEQEVLLYPRICAEVTCRQWKQSKLKDCEGCGQISYCIDKPEHLPKSHQRWCKSYSLYQRLVIHQQTKGRLEPKMPTKIMTQSYQMPDKINEVLASMYEEKIDMNDVQYAALTQLATAPLTAAFGYQVYTDKTNATTKGIAKKSSFTIHVVGAELQFEADALNKWEVFFLHLRPELQELKVVLISTDLNPSNLPLDLLGKIKHCENCRSNKRRVTFSFQDKMKYAEYRSSMDYCYPDLICAFNPSIQRASIYKDLDIWPSTLNTVFRTKAPFILTAYSMTELLRDSLMMKECADADFKVISEAKYNSFASVRPDRNFITDDELPLLFKNYCYMIVCGC